METLSLLSHQSFDHDLNTFVTDVVSTQDELLDSSAEIEALLHCFNTLKTDLVLLDIENFKVFLVSQ